MGLRPTPATNESAGPFRKVVGTRPAPTEWTPDRIMEILECGHTGMSHRDRPWATAVEQVKQRRRCWPCQHAANQAAKQKP